MSHPRRSRMQRTTTGKRIALSERDIEIFRLLARYRYLRSTYIHAFVGGASETRLKERMGDLFHEGYLDRPSQQWEFADARHAPVVYESGRGARQALCAVGEGDGESRRTAPPPHKQFLHTLMTCEALASIELAVRASDCLRFIAWPEILAKAPTATQALNMPLRLPLSSGGSLVPDAVFGIEYGGDDARRYRFFALEADRGTMPIGRTRPGQTSYLGKLAAYREAIGQQVHNVHWGTPNLLVLTLTTGEARMLEIITKLGADASPAFLFKALEAKALTSPVPQLLSEPWLRAGHAALSIAESR